MHNKVVYRIARGLRHSGAAVMRFNYRGVNLSEGVYANGEGEVDDARAALALLRLRYPDLPVSTQDELSGKLRLFREHELSVDALLASACLPTVHRAIEIDGEPYWDGGYAANPAVFPLFFDCTARDILLVMLTPLKHRETPSSAPDIRTRVLEIAFNATFLREMRMFAHLRERVGSAWFTLGRYERRLTRTNFHVIEAQDVMGDLKADTKLAANLQFFDRLKQLGRARAQAWLRTHHAHLGRQSTVNLRELFY